MNWLRRHDLKLPWDDAALCRPVVGFGLSDRAAERLQCIKVPGYTTVNLAANYALRDDVTLFARIDNLLNKQYEDLSGFLGPGFGIYGGIRLTAGGSPSGVVSRRPRRPLREWRRQARRRAAKA